MKQKKETEKTGVYNDSNEWPGMMGVKKAARLWGVTPQRVGQLLLAGRVPGAVRRAEMAWGIPEGTLKPDDRKKGRPCAPQEECERCMNLKKGVACGK